MTTVYRDRSHAGVVLAERLEDRFRGSDVVVLGLPRGGVPVAAEVARALGAPLDVFSVRKLGVPGHEELAFGAIGSGGVLISNEEVVAALAIPEATIEAVAARENEELRRREHLYRGDRPPRDIAGRTVLLVDDGLATGASMRAAVVGAKMRGATRTVVAVPVGSPHACSILLAEADEVVCALSPASFVAVGSWYEDFSQVSDAAVTSLLSGKRGEDR